MYSCQKIFINSYSHLFIFVFITFILITVCSPRMILAKELPDHIDQSIDYENETDLRVSHIGVYTRKHK